MKSVCMGGRCFTSWSGIWSLWRHDGEEFLIFERTILHHLFEPVSWNWNRSRTRCFVRLLKSTRSYPSGNGIKEMLGAGTPLFVYSIILPRKTYYIRKKKIEYGCVTKAVLERHGLQQKSFGQNLINLASSRIVDTAEIDKQVNVIESDPGIGAHWVLAWKCCKWWPLRLKFPILADTLRDLIMWRLAEHPQGGSQQYIAEFKKLEASSG